MIRPVQWRREDEELYQRLRDRQRFARLHVALAPKNDSSELALVPERALGLLAFLRSDAAGRGALSSADVGDLSSLQALIFARSYEGKRPGLLHHLALLHGQVAKRHLGEKSVTHTLHALAAWGVLRSEGTYLQTMAKDVAPELDDAARAAAIREAATAPLDHLRQRALADAATRGPSAYAALRLHQRRDELTALMGVQSLETIIALRALGGEVTDAAMEPIERALDDAATTRVGDVQVDLLARLASLAGWAGGSRDVDHRFLERAIPIAWTLYKGTDKVLLERFIATTRECVDRCAARVLSDSTELSQASRVAQMFVFRAESARTLSGQVVAIEKALEVCPTHRNGRLVGADIFAFRGLERLRGTGPVSRASPADAALADAHRARELWPRCKRLVRLTEELARVGRFLPAEDSLAGEDGEDL